MSSTSAMASRQPSNPTQAPAPRASGSTPTVRNSITAGSERKPGISNGAPAAKRKADDGDAGPPPKNVKTEPNGAPSRTTLIQKAPATSSAKPSSSVPTTSVPYRGTARADAPSNPTKPAVKATPKPGTTAGPGSATTVGASGAPVPKKGGFASVLARARAAQEVHGTAAVTTIKHTPREKPPKISRSRMQQEAMEKQQSTGKNGKMAVQAARGKVGASVDGKSEVQKKKGPAEVGYKGTMRKAPAPINYKGTMRAVNPSKPARAQSPTDRFGGKAKNGGYADWSDLSDAEEEPAEDSYESESDMEGGFDEVENEELMAARIARKEDQEAMEEEERHRKEKLERKKKLEALSNQAKGKKRF